MMKNNHTSLLLLSFYLLISSKLITSIDAKSKVYIVHMGKRRHGDLKLLKKTHHQLLAKAFGSEEESRRAMVYSYRHGFSGFAAKLTETQAQIISDELGGAGSVTPNRMYKIQTTRSWDYLQVSSYSSSSSSHKYHSTHLLHNNSKIAQDVIVALLDTGIWPESETFNDEGLEPIPSRWRGRCESGQRFDPAVHCNRKLIGARFFVKALEAEYGQPYNATDYNDFLSPRDSSSHGTHTSTIAAGSPVPNRSYRGLGAGTVRGGATRARIAMYKVCWNLMGGICADADILKAFDVAVRDGADVVSASIAPDIPPYPETERLNGLSVGAFHAVAAGIVVVCAAGNSGPTPQTVENTSPWILTVGASSTDRSFTTRVTLGNNWTTAGQAIFTGSYAGFIRLVYPEVSDLETPRDCKTLTRNDTWVAGKVVLCFTSAFEKGSTEYGLWGAWEAGARGVIVGENPTRKDYYCLHDFPCVQVTYDVAMTILHYIRSTKSPTVRISPTKTHDGRPVPTNLAYFSSRGPSSVSPAVLKPDVAAPGVNILSAITNGSFDFMSGTSMATPHVSGIVALLKSLHPDWSPAAIKSAIITTAWNTDPYGEPIFAEGEPVKLADPFDFGGGIVNFNGAANPGLVYDMGTEDYIRYLCAMRYTQSSISQLAGRPDPCPTETPSILDLNLASITIPSLRKSTTLTRTVRNVGHVNSSYKAIINPPQGISISVRPSLLVFNSATTSVSFTVTVSTTHLVTTGYFFGSLTWSSGVHSVRSPISVRTEIPIY